MLAGQKKLTIAIPTYNRAKYLDVLLNSILIQYPQVKDNVEIIISDNASTDNTVEVIEKYKNSGIEVLYFCQPINLGPDKNIANCFTHSSGEYVWIMGDDDYFLPNAILIILSLLTSCNNEIAILHVKATIPERLVSFEPEHVNFKIVDKYTYVKKINVFLTFISGNIVNKNMFVKHESQEVIKTYFDTNLVQLSWVYKLVTVGDKFIIYNHPLIITMDNNTGGYKFFDVFATNQSKIAAHELKDYPELIKYIEKGTLLRFFPQWINLYLNGKMETFDKNNDLFIILKNVYGKYFEFWVFIYPLKLMPKMLRRVLIKILRTTLLLHDKFLR